MMAPGYSEFHRAFLSEVDRDGLIVDARYNLGGHVSQLLLEKLARRRIGYDHAVDRGCNPYPSDSPQARSLRDKRIFWIRRRYFQSLLQIDEARPLIGKRTWGGVIGIDVNEFHVDGSLTTQPEYSFWFVDLVGWGVEKLTAPIRTSKWNLRPQDGSLAGIPSSIAEIEEALRLLKEHARSARSKPGRRDFALPAASTRD